MRTNWTRMLLGGLLAGLVIDLCEFLVNGLILGTQWAEAMKALNAPSQMGAVATVVLWLWGFLVGIYAMALYVSIRPRFGAGPKTAALTGVAVWIPASLLALMPPVAMHLFPYGLIAIGIVWSLVEMVLGTIAGAWLYRDREEAPAQTVARAA